ncbi:hypothetical protein ACFL1B_04655 [Nanoarchaeota archaeon]
MPGFEHIIERTVHAYRRGEITNRDDLIGAHAGLEVLNVRMLSEGSDEVMENGEDRVTIRAPGLYEHWRGRPANADTLAKFTPGYNESVDIYYAPESGGKFEHYPALRANPFPISQVSMHFAPAGPTPRNEWTNMENGDYESVSEDVRVQVKEYSAVPFFNMGGEFVEDLGISCEVRDDIKGYPDYLSFIYAAEAALGTGRIDALVHHFGYHGMDFEPSFGEKVMMAVDAYDAGIPHENIESVMAVHEALGGFRVRGFEPDSVSSRVLCSVPEVESIDNIEIDYGQIHNNEGNFVVIGRPRGEVFLRISSGVPFDLHESDGYRDGHLFVPELGNDSRLKFRPGRASDEFGLIALDRDFDTRGLDAFMKATGLIQE